MGNGLYGVNARTLGISRDQIAPVVRALAPAFTLIHDDPALAAMLTRDTRVIYRQTGDEDTSVDVASFIGERAKNAPPGALIHTVNERGLSPALAQREIECMKAAEALGRRCCIINAATHQSAADWQTMRPAIEYAVRNGHAVGAHVYLDGKLDQYAWEFVPLMREYGGTWLLTEFAPIADIRDPFTGWRGFMSASAVADWIRGITPTLKRLNLPACWYSLDMWPHEADKRERGFGVYGIAEIIDTLVSANSAAQWSESMSEQPTNPRPAVVTITPSVNLRPTPSKAQPKIATIPAGAAITVWTQPVSQNDGLEWVQAQWGDVLGYVAISVKGVAVYKFTDAPLPEAPTPGALYSLWLTLDEAEQFHALVQAQADLIKVAIERARRAA